MSSEEDIRRLLALCAQRIDDRDLEGYVALFAPEGRLVTRSRAFIGVQAIHACMADGWDNSPAGIRTKHLLGGSIVHVTGDTATASTDVVAFQCLPEGGWNVLLAGRYEDEFVIHDGDWRFWDRRIAVEAYLHSHFAG